MECILMAIEFNCSNAQQIRSNINTELANCNTYFKKIMDAAYASDLDTFLRRVELNSPDDYNTENLGPVNPSHQTHWRKEGNEDMAPPTNMRNWLDEDLSFYIEAGKRVLGAYSYSTDRRRVSKQKIVRTRYSKIDGTKFEYTDSDLLNGVITPIMTAFHKNVEAYRSDYKILSKTDNNLFYGKGATVFTSKNFWHYMSGWHADRDTIIEAGEEAEQHMADSIAKIEALRGCVIPVPCPSTAPIHPLNFAKMSSQNSAVPSWWERYAEDSTAPGTEGAVLDSEISLLETAISEKTARKSKAESYRGEFLSVVASIRSVQDTLNKEAYEFADTIVDLFDTQQASLKSGGITPGNAVTAFKSSLHNASSNSGAIKSSINTMFTEISNLGGVFNNSLTESLAGKETPAKEISESLDSFADTMTQGMITLQRQARASTLSAHSLFHNYGLGGLISKFSQMTGINNDGIPAGAGRYDADDVRNHAVGSIVRVFQVGNLNKVIEDIKAVVKKAENKIVSLGDEILKISGELPVLQSQLADRKEEMRISKIKKVNAEYAAYIRKVWSGNSSSCIATVQLRLGGRLKSEVIAGKIVLADENIYVKLSSDNSILEVTVADIPESLFRIKENDSQIMWVLKGTQATTIGDQAASRDGTLWANKNSDYWKLSSNSAYMPIIDESVKLEEQWSMHTQAPNAVLGYYNSNNVTISVSLNTLPLAPPKHEPSNLMANATSVCEFFFATTDPTNLEYNGPTSFTLEGCTNKAIGGTLGDHIAGKLIPTI
jgi:hypothetical protein